MPILEHSGYEIFAQQVARGKSQREAYRAAGFESIADDTVDAAASRLLTDVRVSTRVAEVKALAAKRAEITLERVLVEQAKLAFSDVRKAVKWGDGVGVFDAVSGEAMTANGVALIASDAIDDDTGAGISEVSQGRDGIKIKMHDKGRALDSLMKHLGGYATDNVQKGEAQASAVIAALVAQAQGTNGVAGLIQAKPDVL